MIRKKDTPQKPPRSTKEKLFLSFMVFAIIFGGIAAFATIVGPDGITEADYYNGTLVDVDTVYSDYFFMSDGNITARLTGDWNGTTFTVTNITIAANTIDTNEWANLDGLDQTVATTSRPTFNALTGTSYIIGANTLTTVEWAFLDGIDQSLAQADSPTFNALTATSIIIGADTIDTNEWAFLDGLDQALAQADAVTFSTMDTGQGANELYDMDQNVQTTDNFTTAGVGITGNNKLQFRDDAIFIYSSIDGVLTFVSDSRAEFLTKVRVEGTNRLEFRDTGLYIYSSQDGVLAFVADSRAEYFTKLRMNVANRLEFRDTGLYVSSEDDGHLDLTADISIDLNGAIGTDLTRTANNTGAIGSDAVRWANVWATTVTGKSIVTGSVFESEIAPLPGETFTVGDIVKVYDENYFTKADGVLDNVLGIVAENPAQVITGYETRWDLIEVPLTETIEIRTTITDAQGNSYTSISYDERPVYETIFEDKEILLENGTTITITVPVNSQVMQTVNQTTETPIRGWDGNYGVIVGGQARTKISESVSQGDLIVAGPDGVGMTLDIAIELMKVQYSGAQLNWNNVLEVIQILNARILGEVMADSDGPYCYIMKWG